MKTKLFFIAALLLCSCAHAENFHLRWTDVFPECARDSMDYDFPKCAAEIFVPNFKLDTIGNMLYQMAYSAAVTPFTTLIGGTIDSVSNIGAQVLYAIGALWGLVGQSNPFAKPASSALIPSGDLIGDLGKGVLDWFYGIITPFLVIVLLFSIKFTLTYLEICVPLRLFTHILHVQADEHSSEMIAIISVALMFLGTIWFLGSDFGLYKPLIIF